MEEPATTNPLWTGFILLVIAFFYFLPSLVGKDKHNASAIFLLNLFLGWTVLGWIVSLVWAVSNDAPRQVLVRAQAAPAHTVASLADELGKLGKLRDEGALTQAEFLQLRAKLLDQSA